MVLCDEGRLPSPIRSGRELQQFVVLGELRSNGRPAESVRIPFNCHPPKTCFCQPLNFIGSSYCQLATNRCGTFKSELARSSRVLYTISPAALASVAPISSISWL